MFYSPAPSILIEIFRFLLSSFIITVQWWTIDDDGVSVKSVAYNNAASASANANVRERLFDAQNYPPQNPYDTYYSGSYNPYSQVGYE